MKKTNRYKAVQYQYDELYYSVVDTYVLGDPPKFYRGVVCYCEDMDIAESIAEALNEINDRP